MFLFIMLIDLLYRITLVTISRNVYINNISFISGVRFRRQHWCLLSILLLIIVLGIAIGLHVNSSTTTDESDSGDLKKSEDEIQVSIPTTDEGRLKAVKQMLKEVPLIDG